MPQKIVRDVLVAASSAGPLALLGGRISPVQTEQDIAFPHCVLVVISADPQNALSGFAGLDSCEVQADVWSLSYSEALSIAMAARAAWEATGNVCISRVTDFFSPEAILEAGAYRVGHIFRVWK